MSPKEKNKLLKQIFEKTVSKMEGRTYDDTMHQYLVDVNNVYNECCIDLKQHFQQLWIKKTGVVEKNNNSVIVKKNAIVVNDNSKKENKDIPLSDEEDMDNVFIQSLVFSNEKAVARDFFLKNTNKQCCIAVRNERFNDTWNELSVYLKKEGIDIDLYIKSLEDAKKNDEVKNSQEEDNSNTEGAGVSNEGGTTQKMEGEKGNISG